MIINAGAIWHGVCWIMHYLISHENIYDAPSLQIENAVEREFQNGIWRNYSTPKVLYLISLLKKAGPWCEKQYTTSCQNNHFLSNHRQLKNHIKVGILGYSDVRPSIYRPFSFSGRFVTNQNYREWLVTLPTSFFHHVL